MLRITNIRVPIAKRGEVVHALCRHLHMHRNQIKNVNIYKESFDARRKYQNFVYTVDIEVDNEAAILNKRINGVSKTPNMKYTFPQPGEKVINNRPVVVGSGPCGLFVAYMLAKLGYAPLLIDRGADVLTRAQIVDDFWERGILNANTNVQFGEGGAGTFSDGKLTTNIKDKRCRYVLETLVNNGAPKDILYSYRPHVGTDVLRTVVKNIRQAIIHAGGEVRFNTTLTGLKLMEGCLKGIFVNDNQFIPTSTAVLAIGHSARDTYQMLYNAGIVLEPKAFSVGVRIEHLQSDLNKAQFGEYANHPNLEPADYRLKYHGDNGRSAYSFCMCPGGIVVASSSDLGGVVTNGMSYRSRDGVNANSALLVGVTPQDYPSSHALSGVLYQQQWEQLAFQLAGGNYKAPVQLVGDFLNNKESKAPGVIKPSYLPGVKYTDLSKCLPTYVTETLKHAIRYWGKAIEGFDNPEAVLTGVETRSSAPVRILRNEEFVCNIKGLYPAGEGAGYAGGIVSAAVDGLRVAEAIVGKYQPL